MHKGYFHRVTAQTPTRFWINNVTREQADLALEAGAVGCTQNPSYPYKMLMHETEKQYAYGMLDAVMREHKNKEPDEIQEIFQRELVREIANRFLPLYKKTQGRQGFVSIQGNPLKEDLDTILRGARFNREAGENIMAKVPATKEGIEAIEILMEERIPINATEVMSSRQVLDICDVYERAASRMKHPPVVYFSHITGILDQYLKAYVTEQEIQVSEDALWQAGIICARKAHRLVKERDIPVGFIGGGARGLHHFTEMVGADCCITINWAGTADKLIELNQPVIDRFHGSVPETVLDGLLERIDEFRRAWYCNGVKPDEYEEFGPVVLFRDSFVSAWTQANQLISSRKETI